MKITIGYWPLAVKLWGAFAALTLFIFALLAVLLPWTLKGFFTEQLYDILLDTQSGLRVGVSAVTSPAAPMNQLTVPVDPVATSTLSISAVPGTTLSAPEAVAEPGKRVLFISKTDATSMSAEPITFSRRIPLEGPAIQHFMISGTEQAPSIVPAASVSEPFVKAMEKAAFTQSVPIEKYTYSLDNKSIFYVIRKEMVQGQPNFIVSYASGNYRNDLVLTMFIRLMLLMVGLIVFSWLPCLVLARYFTRPLVQMEQHVGRLADRDWHEPLETGRKDEIGRLAKAIETMRQRLVRQDRAQQFFLQHTSHELKTPVMVIRSYAQSILDGVFPKGSLQASVGVIMKEGERLEKRIRDLLLLNKLNYLTSREKPFQTFKWDDLIHDAIERLRYRRPEIDWDILLQPNLPMTGDPEQWMVALENLFDNQLRYARTGIHLSVKSSGKEGSLPVIKISNDGPPLDDAVAESLFEPFRSGGDGQFGLGLAIVKQIAEHHGMTVRAENESEGDRPGVAFYLEPAPAKQTVKHEAASA